MAQQQQKQFGSMYPNNMTHERVFSRWGTNPEGTSGNLNITATGNTIRLKIYTGMQEDKAKQQGKSIDFKFEAPELMDFFAIIDSFNKILAIPLDGQAHRIGYGIKAYRNGGYVEAGKIIIGRDAEGVYYISGIDNNHGKMKFELTFGRNVIMYEMDSNEPASQAVKSEIYVRSWMESFKIFMAPIYHGQYVDKVAEKEANNNNKGGRGNGGYQQRSNNNYGNNNQQQRNNPDSYSNSDDDDLYLP